MEASRAQEIKVGLLLVFGIAALVVLVLWSDRVSFQRYYAVAAFVDNAGGLRVGSPVTLTGIRIGEVQAVTTNRDTRGAVRVDLKLKSDYPVAVSSELRLLTSGLFGDSYLEFAAPKEDTQQTLATDGSAWVRVSPNLLDTVTGQANEILEGVRGLLAEENRTHIASILANLDRLSMHSADLALESRSVLADMQRLSQASQELVQALQARQASLGAALETALAQLSQSGQQVLTQAEATLSKVDQAVAHVGGAASTVEGMLQERRADLMAMVAGFARLSQDLSTVAEQVRTGQGIAGRLLSDADLAARFDRMLVDAQALSERLAQNPEVLLWGQTSEEAAAVRAQREAMQARRAFMAGDRFVPPPAQKP